MRYVLKYPLSERSCLPCAFRDEVFDLSGKGYERVIPASINGPEKRIRVRGATQKDLKALYEAGGHEIIEKVETIRKPKQTEQSEDVGTD